MRSILHILIAGLLFIAQTGVLVHQHYCKEQLMDTRLFVKAPTCHQPVEGKTCPMHASSKADDKPCCDDKAQYASIDLFGFAPDISIWPDIDLSIDLVWYPVSDFYSISSPVEQQHIYIHRPPPDLRKHLSLYQVYRC